MAHHQHFQQTTQFQIRDVNGTEITLSEVAEWDDSNAIERLTFRGPKEGIEILIGLLGNDALPHREEHSDGSTGVTYDGIAALDANSAKISLDLPFLERKKVTTFVVTNESGDQETVCATRHYVWDATASGWVPQGETDYWAESNYPVTRQGGCDFEIKGNSYKSQHHVVYP